MKNNPMDTRTPDLFLPRVEAPITNHLRDFAQDQEKYKVEHTLSV